MTRTVMSESNWATSLAYRPRSDRPISKTKQQSALTANDRATNQALFKFKVAA